MKFEVVSPQRTSDDLDALVHELAAFLESELLAIPHARQGIGLEFQGDLPLRILPQQRECFCQYLVICAFAGEKVAAMIAGRQVHLARAAHGGMQPLEQCRSRAEPPQQVPSG